MNYSQALESLIQEIVYYGDSAERREKVHRQALLDGVDPDEVDIIIKGRLHKAKSQTTPSMPQTPPPPPTQQMAPPPPPSAQMAPPPPPPPVQPQYSTAPVYTSSKNTDSKKIFTYAIGGACIIIGLAFGLYFTFFGSHSTPAETAEATVENKEVTDTVVVVKKETVYDNNESLKDELKSKIMSIWAEGVQGGNSLFMFKKYCSKDFCDTYDKYEKFLNGDFGSLDYDVWTQAQDTDGFKYKVKDILATGERNVTVIMELTNFGQTQQLKVMLVKESDKWVIDDFVNAQHSCKQLMREDMNQ